MDKVVMKSLLRDAGLPQARFVSFRTYKKAEIRYEAVVSQLGEPFFIKPANMGSSVGISKVHNKSEFDPALQEAFAYDDKIIMEQYISGREIECAILGNDDPIASVVGEVLPTHEFYDYEAKYIDNEGARFEIPANLPAAVANRIKQLAIEAFRVLNCAGMARVDFFLQGENGIFINELNSIPGFTKISMYPKLWEASGLSYTQLIDRLIELAIERHIEINSHRT
jgi:D-alanine-D-alanine ligase